MTTNPAERQTMNEEAETGLEPVYGQLMTKADVAERLGMKESMITQLVSSGDMPHLRLGKRKFVRFTEEHIQQYLRSKEVPAHSSE